MIYRNTLNYGGPSRESPSTASEVFWNWWETIQGISLNSVNDIGAGSLFGISDLLKAGTHDLDLQHSTTSMLNTSGANLVYVVLDSYVNPA
jgi:hypothetical protein